MRAILIPAGLMLLATPTDALAWNAFSPCMAADLPEASEQERGWFRDRFCNARELRDMRRLYGARPLRLAAGSRPAVRVAILEGRRYVDGVSHNVLMVDAIERGDHVDLVMRVADGRRQSVRRTISLQAWADLARRASALANAPGVEPPGDDLWIHPMEVVVETHGFGAPRVLYTTIAERGPAYELGAEIMRLVWDAMSHCHEGSGEPSPWIIRDCIRGRLD